MSAGDEDEGDLEEGEEKEEKLPTCGDYVMHFISVPWKVLCAICPPTGKKIFLKFKALFGKKYQARQI